MYTVQKTFEIAGSHKLDLPYDSSCSRLHGHNWKITVEVSSQELNDEGMVVDFALVKRAVHGALDHRNINEIVDFNPTAENMAKWIEGVISVVVTRYSAPGACITSVTVQESKGNVAKWTR